MEYVRLGRSNLMISRVAMGAMSLNKVGSEEKASVLVRNAYNKGINFFDTSRNSIQNEQLLGDSIYDIRSSVVIASKTTAQSGAEVLNDVETSLGVMHTDYIDLYQYESDLFVPQANGPDGIYNAFCHLKKAEKSAVLELPPRIWILLSRLFKAVFTIRYSFLSVCLAVNKLSSW